MTNTNNTPTNPDEPESDNREPLQVIVIGTPAGIPLMIQKFAKIGYAISEWSAPEPAHRPGLVKCTLTRYIPKQ